MNRKLEFEEALEAWCKENGIVWTKMEKRFYHLFSKGEPGSTEFEIERCFGEGSPCISISESHLSTIKDLVNSKEEFVKYSSDYIINEFEMSKDPLYLDVYGI